MTHERMRQASVLVQWNMAREDQAVSILNYEIRTREDGDLTGWHLFRFTRDQYHAMAELGAFEGRRVELIEGEIIEMPPIGNEHAAVNVPVADLLKVAFGQGYVIR